jgi:hypothetical protein
MADLDVSEVITDPLFTSPVRLIAVDEPTDDYGNPEWKDFSEVTVQAVVTAVSNRMETIPDELRIDGAIRVVFPSDEAPANWQGTGRDAVIWRGRRYVVKDVTDNSQFGRGFYRLICWPEEVNPLQFGFDQESLRVRGWDDGRWRQ